MDQKSLVLTMNHILPQICNHKYTHGNKLGNTFSSWGKFVKNPFSFFSGDTEIFSHIYFIPWPSYRPIYGNSQHFVFVLRRIQYAICEKLHFYGIQVCLFASALRKTQFLTAKQE